MVQKFSNICMVCKRPLKDLKSKIRGYGPTCYEKVHKNRFKMTKLIKDIKIDNE